MPSLAMDHKHAIGRGLAAGPQVQGRSAPRAAERIISVHPDRWMNLGPVGRSGTFVTRHRTGARAIQTACFPGKSNMPMSESTAAALPRPCFRRRPVWFALPLLACAALAAAWAPPVLAQAVAEGARSAGASVDVKRVPETVPQEIAQSAHFKLDQAAPVASVAELVNYDAIIVGAPTRFGRMPSQMAAFLDLAGGLWARGALNG